MLCSWVFILSWVWVVELAQRTRNAEEIRKGKTLLGIIRIILGTSLAFCCYFKQAPRLFLFQLHLEMEKILFLCFLMWLYWERHYSCICMENSILKLPSSDRRLSFLAENFESLLVPSWILALFLLRDKCCAAL